MSLPLVLAPLKHRQFAWLCAGTMIAALGTWIQSTTSAWIMTDLAPDALMVSLTQAAAQLPILFLVVPAGALADLVDRRRYLVLTNVWMLAAAALLAVLYALGLVGPWLLLALTALLSVGVALNAPAWSSSVPLTVPRDDLPRAVLLNSMAFNLARAIGPALGGILVAAVGAAYAFALNAASFALVAVISGAVLAFPVVRPLGGLPPESKGRAILLGFRYVAAEPNVRAAMVRSLAFYGLASAIWALLPIFVRQKLGMSAAGYGVMLGATGVGAMLGGIMMPWLNGRLSRDNQVMLGGVVCSGYRVRDDCVRVRLDPCCVQPFGDGAIGQCALGAGAVRGGLSGDIQWWDGVWSHHMGLACRKCWVVRNAPRCRAWRHWDGIGLTCLSSQRRNHRSLTAIARDPTGCHRT